MVELARIDSEPLGELLDIYRKQPIFYITNRFSVGGTNTTVKWTCYSNVMDYELEYGIITRNKGANISPIRAKDHIFGYTIFNDFSARDAQRIEMEGRRGRPRAKVLTAATSWGRGSLRRTRSVIPTMSYGNIFGHHLMSLFIGKRIHGRRSEEARLYAVDRYWIFGQFNCR